MTEEAVAPAPEPAPTEGISPDAVASDQSAPVAPDASIVADQFNQRYAEPIEQRRQQEADYERIQQDLALLERLRGGDFQKQYDETSQKIKEADDGQSQLMKQLQQKLDQMSERQEQWEHQLQRQQEQAEYNRYSEQVSSWVREQADHFPLVNAIGEQQIVFQKMMNTRDPQGRMISEAQAAREVEAELRNIVERCAPELGFTRSNVSRESEEQVSLNSAMSVGQPADRENLTDEEHLQYLLRQYQGQ